MTKKIVRENTEYFLGDDELEGPIDKLPERLDKLIKFVQTKKPDLRDLQIDSEWFQDGGSAYRIYGYREETDREYAWRMKQEEAELKKKAKKEKAEIELYKKLKKKYGDI